MSDEHVEPADAVEDLQDLRRHHDSGRADLEKVTDYVEEAEIDAKHLDKAMTALKEKQLREHQEKAAREKEFASVVVRPEDVDLIVRELEVSKARAEQTLREQKGNLMEALRFLVH